MELDEIIEQMKNPESLIEPNQLVQLVGYIDGFVTHYELEVDDLELAQSLRWDAIKASEHPVLTDKQTNMRLIRDPISVNLKRTKRTLSELKRYRNYLYRKLDIIMGIKRRG